MQVSALSVNGTAGGARTFVAKRSRYVAAPGSNGVYYRMKNSMTADAVPTTSDLLIGEMAINPIDKIIYMRNPSGTVITIGGFYNGTDLPTSDPIIVSALWNDNGVVKISEAV